MARITPIGQEALPNPSKVIRQENPFGDNLLGHWGATSPRQAWTRLEVTAQNRIKITAGHNNMNGVLNAHPSGELLLSLYSGAGESTANLEGHWRLEADQLFLEFRAMDMHFRRMQKLTDTHF
jgi:hypothetical protein